MCWLTSLVSLKFFNHLSVRKLESDWLEYLQGAEKFPFQSKNSKRPNPIKFKATLVAQSLPNEDLTRADFDEEKMTTKAHQQMLELKQKEVQKGSIRTAN